MYIDLQRSRIMIIFRRISPTKTGIDNQLMTGLCWCASRLGDTKSLIFTSMGLVGLAKTKKHTGISGSPMGKLGAAKTAHCDHQVQSPQL